MLIRVLEVIHYPPEGVTAAGESWESIYRREPEWRTIETAIRQLDRDVYPFLWLHIDAPTEFDEPSHSLNVMGGRGEYAISAFRRGAILYYFDGKRDDSTIRIWESDQGSIVRRKDLCHDFALVLEIARYFAETGELYPHVNWCE